MRFNPAHLWTDNPIVAKIGGFTIIIVTGVCIFLAWLINWFFNHAHPLNLNPFGKSLTEAAPYECVGFWGNVVPWCYLQETRQYSSSAWYLDPTQHDPDGTGPFTGEIIFPDDVWTVAFNMLPGDVFLFKKLPIIEEGCWIPLDYPPWPDAVTIEDHGTYSTYTANEHLDGYNVFRMLLHFVNSPETVPPGGIGQNYVQCFR